MAVLMVLMLVASGVALAVQAPINGGLARSIGGALPSAAVSFAVGLLALAGLSILTGQGGAFARLGNAPSWQLTGGLLGAFYVGVVVWSVQGLGVVTVLAALVLGQLLGGLALDATGAFGLPVREISLTRILAVAMVGGGLLLSRW